MYSYSLRKVTYNTSNQTYNSTSFQILSHIGHRGAHVLAATKETIV
jgi:hypothetical protein